MTKPATLYLFIGYPGAGKTTASKIVAEATGATHIWADRERHKLFGEPTHSHQESAELYEQLNQAAEYLLAQGKSVVFDTNFNFRADRQKLREIASKHKAQTVVIWINTPLGVARSRSVDHHETRNGYPLNMTAGQFQKIVTKLEPPAKDEKVIKIDGTKLDEDHLRALLQE